MSLILPDDSIDLTKAWRSGKRRGKAPTLLDRLKGISRIPAYIQSLKSTPHEPLAAPTGKIRLVTNSWVDRPPARKRCTKPVRD